MYVECGELVERVVAMHLFLRRSTVLASVLPSVLPTSLIVRQCLRVAFRAVGIGMRHWLFRTEDDWKAWMRRIGLWRGWGRQDCPMGLNVPTSLNVQVCVSSRYVLELRDRLIELDKMGECCIKELLGIRCNVDRIHSELFFIRLLCTQK